MTLQVKNCQELSVIGSDSHKMANDFIDKIRDKLLLVIEPM